MVIVVRSTQMIIQPRFPIFVSVVTNMNYIIRNEKKCEGV